MGILFTTTVAPAGCESIDMIDWLFSGDGEETEVGAVGFAGAGSTLGADVDGFVSFSAGTAGTTGEEKTGGGCGTDLGAVAQPAKSRRQRTKDKGQRSGNGKFLSPDF